MRQNATPDFSETNQRTKITKHIQGKNTPIRCGTKARQLFPSALMEYPG